MIWDLLRAISQEAVLRLLTSDGLWRKEKKQKKNSCDGSCCGSEQLLNRLLVSKRSEVSRGAGGGFLQCTGGFQRLSETVVTRWSGKKLVIYTTLRCSRSPRETSTLSEWRLLARDDSGSGSVGWIGVLGHKREQQLATGLSGIVPLLFQRRLPFISQARVFTRGSVLQAASSGQRARAWRHALFQTERTQTASESN